MKKSIILFGLFSLLIKSNAQTGPFGYYNEALLFSQTKFVGTARIQAIGGTQVSLGGDISVAAGNPAGLGFYNSSSLVITPTFNNANSRSDYLNNTLSTFRNNLNFSQLGLVIHKGRPNTIKNDFRGVSFAFSINRVNDFNNEIEYSGINNDNSIINSLVAGESPYTEAAYKTFLINPIPFNYTYSGDERMITGYHTVSNFTGYSSFFDTNLPEQRSTIKTSGGQNQVNLGFGTNYKDKVYFGAGLGLLTLRYKKITIFEEFDYYFIAENENGDNELYQDDLLSDVSIRDELVIRGNGINLTAGMIIRPIDQVTIGASYVSPTYYGLREESFYTFNTTFYDNTSYREISTDTVITNIGGSNSYPDDIVINDSNYNLATPGKLNFGATVFIGKHGFLSGDVEFVDYSKAKLRTDDFAEEADNQEILNLYRSVLNYRFGWEYRLDPFRIRAGYHYMADPYINPYVNRSIGEVSFGLGYKSKDYFIDLSITNQSSKDAFIPYSLSGNEPEASTKSKITRLSISVGFSF